VLLQIDKLKRRPRRIEIDAPAADFPVLRELIELGTVAFEEPIHGTLTATWAGNIIEVSGNLETRVTSSCARCLKPITSHLDIEPLLCYSELTGDEEIVADEVELEGDELGLIRFSGTEIDLQPDIEQEVVMALPQQLLCQERCKGLCPLCGIDLNHGQCRCEPPVFHAGLAALKNFRVE